jgi:hypothetical protein
MDIGSSKDPLEGWSKDDWGWSREMGKTSWGEVSRLRWCKGEWRTELDTANRVL